MKLNKKEIGFYREEAKKMRAMLEMEEIYDAVAAIEELTDEELKQIAVLAAKHKFGVTAVMCEALRRAGYDAVALMAAKEELEFQYYVE